ncbi:MAG TPA: hypothetical protein VFO44_00680 [Steroidobacteraceae bacterium]|nr:hypothetical protein [Steroidobacteraceae bacterium]
MPGRGLPDGLPGCRFRPARGYLRRSTSRAGYSVSVLRLSPPGDLPVHCLNAQETLFTAKTYIVRDLLDGAGGVRSRRSIARLRRTSFFNF